VKSATDAGAVPSATSDFIFSRRIAVSTAAWRSASRSVTGSARPPTSSFSAGRSARALPSVSMRFCASSLSAALPAANTIVDSSSPPPPKTAASSANGAVTALVIRLTITRMMSPPIENSGSSSEPEMGSRMSITPFLSLSSANASSTGSLVASGLSTRWPKVSWSSTMRLSADSLRFSTW